jgi:hypothetical protein
MSSWSELGATFSRLIARTMRCAAATVAAAAVALTSATGAGAAALTPLDLRVDGGEENWQAKRDFALRWSNPPGVAAVHYRLLDPSGGLALGETTLNWASTAIQHLSVPAAPGAYTAEVWLEDNDGTEGAPVSAKLRYDNGVPGRVATPAVGGWIGRTAFPYSLHLGHPAGPRPLSGIRGYAASIDQTPDGSPCAASVCSDAETDLRGGEADDLLRIGELSEGNNYLHAVAISGSGVASAASSNTVLRVDKTDPDTRLAGVPNGWSNQPLTLTAIATDAASGMAAVGNAGEPFTAIQLDGGAPATAAGPVVSASVIASGIHTIAYYARDAAGNVADGGVANGLPNHAPATAMVKIDREPPRIAFAGAQDPLDPERIEAHASDPLSGLDPSRGSIAVRQAGSGERFAELPTQPAGELLRARWDSDAYPPGEYEFRAIAYDRAGNSTSTLSRGGGSPMRLHSPLKVGTTLRATLGRQTVPYGRGASLSGHLLAGRRTPLAAMPVRVIERFDAGASPRERVSTVKTTEAGTFDVRLAPGPSRQVIAQMAPTATLRGAGSRPLRLTVRGGVRMRVSATVADVGGRPIVFRGRVAGDAIPADGKTVELQFRLPGIAWSEFRTIRTDRRGRFRYAYRFADDDSRGARFQFRAFAPAQAGWPFEPAGSAPLAVRGR